MRGEGHLPANLHSAPCRDINSPCASSRGGPREINHFLLRLGTAGGFCVLESTEVFPRNSWLLSRGTAGQGDLVPPSYTCREMG